jgi:hypothetical protein
MDEIESARRSGHSHWVVEEICKLPLFLDGAECGRQYDAVLDIVAD